MKRVAIIGGGASGLIAAIVAAKSGVKVDIYEQNEKVGKKILASGNGRCNISNTSLKSSHYFGENPSFVNFALKEFDFAHFKKFFKPIGIILDIKSDKKVYPLSNEAKSVVFALKNCAKRYHVEIFCNSKIKSITKKDDLFYLTSEDKISKTYSKVLIATGSLAAPQLGANSDGYEFAKSFGHTIFSPYPSLVGLEIDSSFHHKMAGVKIKGEITLLINSKEKEKTTGDILFTKYGISGFGVLDISQSASYALIKKQRVDISLNLLPTYDRQTLTSLIMQLKNSLPSYMISTILFAILPSKIVPHLLLSCTLQDIVSKDISTKTIKQIVEKILNWHFSIKQTHGYKHAEVSGGGVSTKECDEKTMQSKLVKGLYFSGEVLDIVGKRGGYNLHFAWASGYLAGRELAK